MTILIFTALAIVVYWVHPKRWRRAPDINEDHDPRCKHWPKSCNDLE